MTCRLIGLTGKAGSGKSTVSAALVEDGWEVVKFAGGLKAMFRSLMAFQGVDPGEIERMVEGDLKESPLQILCGKTPRHAMQTLGTEWGRDLVHPAIWTNAWVRRCADRLDKGIPVVVDDVRFQNEADIVRGMGGIVIEIVRDTRSEIATASHASENRIEPDYTVGNNGTKVCLIEMVRSVIGGD